MTIVVDASVVVAALVDIGADGAWAEQQLTGGQLAAPHLMPVEVANVLRRAALAGHISDDVATLSHRDLTDIGVALFAYEPLADRVWQLRRTVTAHDAFYVALAERLDVPLATLDRRLATAPGPTCEFRTPATAERP